MRTSRRAAVACGIDIGTTNLKVIVIDPDGAVRARSGRATPRDAQGRSIEGPVLLRSVAELLAEACADSYQIQALCTVGVGEDGLLVDADLRPLTPALAWFDPRRQAIFSNLQTQLEIIGTETFDAAADPARTMVGWAWARPLAGDTARSWIAVADLPAVAWSGRTFLSDTLASRTGAWRAAGRAWAQDRVEMFLGSEHLLPPVLPAGSIVGTVADSLSTTGLRGNGTIAPKALVVVGGHDHSIGSWAVDQMVPGAIVDSMGTAEVILTQSPHPPLSRPPHVDIAPGVQSPGTTLLRVVELARNITWATQDPAVGHSIKAILHGVEAPVGALTSNHFRIGHRGGGSPSYTLDVPRDPQARATAVLGALAGAGRDSVYAVGRGEVNPRLVRLAGGWTRSPGWLEIKASVSGYSAPTIAEPEVAAVGAALLAARAQGWDPDPATALKG